MKKYIPLVLASLLLIIFSTTSVFAFAARANPNGGVRVFGIGEIGECFFKILLNEELGTPVGRLIFSDYPNQKMVFGKITSATVISNSQVNFSGSYAVPGEVSGTFQAVAEDLGTPGDGVDRFSITLSDGYTKSGTLGRGEIDIIQ